MMTDFDKLHKDIMSRMMDKYPKIKDDKSGYASIVESIITISTDTVVEAFKAYEEQQSSHH